ncbi:hypothetical protein [Methanoplanus limicola]|nr:hypothetical protein [Methanoplanus limicola]
MPAISASGSIFYDDNFKSTDVKEITNAGIEKKSTFDDITRRNGINDILNLIKKTPEEEISKSLVNEQMKENISFQTTVKDELDIAAGDFIGPAKIAEEFEIQVFDLIPDSYIINPEYLEKETGIRIIVHYKSSRLNIIQNTVWAFETDATRMLSGIMGGKNRDDIAFIIINFDDVDGRENDVLFKMSAGDVDELDNFPEPGYYIPGSEWTEYKIDMDTEIKYYEDPATKFEFENSKKYISYNDAARVYSADDLREYTIEKSKELNEITWKITDYAVKKDWFKAAEESENLITVSSEYIKEIEKFAVDKNLEGPLEEIKEGFKQYNKAGMDFWYGSYYYNSDRILEGTFSVKSGINHLNSAFNNLEINEIKEERIFRAPVTEMLPKLLKLNEIYKYKDISGSNDISIKIEAYNTAYRYYLKNGNSENTIVTSDYGTKFLFVTLDITHMGYRGGKSQTVSTPSKNDISLHWLNQKISPSTPEQYITGIGVPYSKKKLDRREHFESVLLFIVPEDFNPGNAYIEINLGSQGNPAWSFEYPDISHK